MSFDLKTRIILVLSVCSLGCGKVFGQSGISLYHLSNSTYQGNHFNPAFMPEGKVFVGLPVISGIMIDYNGRIKYDDAVTINESGEKEWDIDNFVDNAKKRNYISLESEISTLYVGWRKSKTKAFSFFIRERIGARGFYADNLVKTFWNGNTSLIGGRIDLSRIAIDVRYYREYGFGIWKGIPNRDINIGIRFKFLNGMISAVTDNKFRGAIGFEENNFEANFDLNNATVFTSGFNVFNSDKLTSHLISNGNLGAGIDLGAHWKINNELSAAVSVNDLGFIRWKVSPKNHTLADTKFRFEGIDLKDVGDLEEAYVGFLKNQFQNTKSYGAYMTGLNTTSYASLMYRPAPNDRFTGSIAAHIVRGNVRMIYSAAYTRKAGRALDISANVSRIPQQGIDLGLAAAVNFGSGQVYIASDKLLRIWDVTKIDAIDFRFGLNLVFRGGKSPKGDDRDLIHPSPYGKKEKVEKSDGIYWIIKKRKPRPIYEKTQFRDN